MGLNFAENSAVTMRFFTADPVLPSQEFKVCWSVCYILKFLLLIITVGARGDAVVEALRYKPEGHGIDYRSCHWNFSLT
jgi:hypothetical protein